MLRKEGGNEDALSVPISEFEESLIKREKCSNLLPVSVIYGPNGGGKSRGESCGFVCR